MLGVSVEGLGHNVCSRAKLPIAQFEATGVFVILGVFLMVLQPSARAGIIRLGT